MEDTDEPYAVSFFAEQVPLAVASFVFADGRPDAIPTACMIGRDADSVATTVGSWVGALCGLSGLPDEWVDTVCEANRAELDLRALADDLADAVD
ncbi:MAG: ADP-ribosylglycohydrolase family protein [Candidatus Brocadiia bacterium]